MITKKLNITITKLKLNEIDDILSFTGIESREEIVDNALTILFWCAAQVRQGRDICAVDSELGLKRELSMPLLECMRKRV